MRERRVRMTSAMPSGSAWSCSLPSSLLALGSPEGSTWARPEGGMFLWARLPQPYDTTALLPQVVRHDVAYVPGAPFYADDPDRSTLRLCFVTQTPEEIGEGLRRLGEGLRGQGLPFGSRP